MRKIDADELIKTIKKVCFSPEWARFRVDFGSNGERDYIINEIVNAPTIKEKTGEWIPKTENLPNQYDRILVTIHVPTREPVVRSGFYHDGLFHIDNGDCWNVFDMEIVAWMPMPEPYKKGEEDGC